MPKPSVAEDYYKQIVEQGENAYSFLAAYVDATPPVQETEWREFKGCEKPTGETSSVPIPDPDVAKYWSKALSGFANTAGGVLIWGLDARTDKELKVDCVGKLALHPDADALRHRLSELLLNAVVPPVRGIEMMTVKKPGAKAGFVVCYIPEGSAKAHRAESADKQFYLRINDNFVIPHVAVIRNLFFPTSSPSLVPSLEVRQRDGNEAQIWFYLTNQGNRTARDIYAVLNDEHNFAYKFMPSGHIYEVLQEKPPFMVRLRDTLHPQIEERILFGLNVPDVHKYYYGMTLNLKTACEDSIMEEWTINISRMALMVAGRLAFTPISP